MYTASSQCRKSEVTEHIKMWGSSVWVHMCQSINIWTTFELGSVAYLISTYFRTAKYRRSLQRKAIEQTMDSSSDVINIYRLDERTNSAWLWRSSEIKQKLIPRYTSYTRICDVATNKVN